MATSPNYAWAEPDNSSLVKNGASDIRTLGDAIDTSVWNVGFGQAGKNKIINGDFTINQRNFTSITANTTFGFDRFRLGVAGGGTTTWTPQTFTPGTAPVAGYEATNFARLVTTSQTAVGDRSQLIQSIENVRTFAGQTATVSFWAKAATGTPSISVEFLQSFGTGGSPSASVTSIGAVKIPITTSWARYSTTINVPSISGKTLGTDANTSSIQLSLWVSAGSDFNARTGSLGNQNNTFDIWGVQAEYGSKATPFQTASGGSIQSELAMCQRYYFRTTPTAGTQYGLGYIDTTTTAILSYWLPVAMRIAPTALETSGTASDYTVRTIGGGVTAATVVPAFGNSTFTNAAITFTSTGLTAGQPTNGRAANTSAYLGWSAEL